MRYGKRIKKLQDVILSKGDYYTQLRKASQELEELREEVEKFLLMSGRDITNRSLAIPCRNMQKEIEDAANMIGQLRKMFNRTHDQRKRTRECKKQIVQQMESFIKNRGM